MSRSGNLPPFTSKRLSLAMAGGREVTAGAGNATRYAWLASLAALSSRPR
jgi:hypothetical protein